MRTLKKYIFSLLFLSIVGCCLSAEAEKVDINYRDYSLLLIEESSNILGIYDPNTGKELGRVALTRWPHEIEVSEDKKEDKKRAYITNFGIRDHDLTVGDAGNSVSVIDLENFCEVDRLFTIYGDEKFWAPHAVKLSPGNKFLFVNAERVGSRYVESTEPSQAKILVFNLTNKKMQEPIKIPEFAPGEKSPTISTPSQAYKALGGMHNFVFSPDGQSLWYFAGKNDVVHIDLYGNLLHHFNDFNGAVRALSFNGNGTLLVSANNEVSIIDAQTQHPKITKQFKNLGVTQLLYSEMTKDSRYILCPAVWEGQLVIINAQPTEPNIKLISTGIDPVHVKIEPQGRFAYVTHGRSNWVTEVDLRSLEEKDIKTRNILTTGGPNGIGFGPLILNPPKPGIIKLGACLPFTGEFAAEGRECRLGLQFWQDVVNGSGGIVRKGKKYLIDVVYTDTCSKTDENLAQYANQLLLSHPDILTMLGTFPSAANLHIAQALDGKNIPFLTSTGRESSLYEKKFEHVFGISSSRNNGDLTGALHAIFKHVSPKPKTAIILACDHEESRNEAIATASVARDLGIEILSKPSSSQLFTIDKASGALLFTHDHKSSNLSRMEDIIENLKTHYPDLVLVAGHRQESVQIVQACAKHDFTPGAFVFNTNVMVPYFQDQLGPLAQNLFSSVSWTKSCSDFALDQFVASGDFNVRFSELHSVNPSEYVASFAACGVVLEEAFKKIEMDDSLTLMRALKMVHIPLTFYGPISLHTKQNHEKQMLIIQFRQDGKKMEEVIVWPPELAKGEKPIWPFPGWTQS